MRANPPFSIISAPAAQVALVIGSVTITMEIYEPVPHQRTRYRYRIFTPTQRQEFGGGITLDEGDHLHKAEFTLRPGASLYTGFEELLDRLCLAGSGLRHVGVKDQHAREFPRWVQVWCNAELEELHRVHLEVMRGDYRMITV